MNKPLTAEEAKNLTFPCLLEVWNNTRCGNYILVAGLTTTGKFKTICGGSMRMRNAALPSPEIAEAMRKQFAPKSEFPKRMLVWDNDESQAEPGIVIADLGEKAVDRYITVLDSDESKFENGERFNWIFYNHAKPIPEPDPIAQEIAELRERLAELKAKYNQQS